MLFEGVAGTTWAVLYKTAQPGQAGPDRSATVGFLRWTVHDGQKFCSALGYAPLPPGLVERADAKLNSLEAGGR